MSFVTRGQSMLYLIGPPGSGKSTLREALMRGTLSSARTRPFAHIIHRSPGGMVIELGGQRRAFSGTDVLALNVQPRVVDWLGLHRWTYVFAEGDRLANLKFFDAVRSMGYNLRVVYLDADEELLAARRAARATKLGAGAQDPSWVRGRVTKHANLAEATDALHVDASAPIDDMVAAVAGDPVARALLDGRAH